MKKQLDLVKEFHDKFKTPVLTSPSLIPKERSKLRFLLMKEEVEEYQKGIEDQDLKNIAKELADILYVVYGTILEHGLQEKIEEVFEEVHRSNLSKDQHQFKMVKGKKFFKADIDQFIKG